jgi:hypothetical protein
MEALSSSETSVFTSATGRNIPEDGILHSRHRVNLKSSFVFLFITILEIIHCPVFYLNTRRFGEWILSASPGGIYSNGPSE